MRTLQKIIDWIDAHPEAAFDLVRFYLGIGLFVRGVLIIGAPETSVEQLLGSEQPAFVSAAVMHYVALAHLFGGALLAIGLITRIAALVQLPILIGAVFFVHVEEGLLATGQSLEFSALVLFLLIVVFLFGPGRWSADRYVFEREMPATEARRDSDGETIAPIYWGDEGYEPEPEAAAATAVAAEADVREKVAQEEDVPRCSCGHDLTHPRVTVEPRYTWWVLFYFLMGISAPVKEVVFWCEKCGTVMKRSRDPELRRKFRYRTD